MAKITYALIGAAGSYAIHRPLRSANAPQMECACINFDPLFGRGLRCARARRAKAIDRSRPKTRYREARALPLWAQSTGSEMHYICCGLIDNGQA